MTETNTDTNIETLGTWTLFSRVRPDDSTYFYSVPAGFQFVLMEGVDKEFGLKNAFDKFKMFVDMAARGGPGFRMKIGPENDPDLI